MGMQEYRQICKNRDRKINRNEDGKINKNDDGKIKDQVKRMMRKKRKI
jgi:hypothetical protein